VRHGSSDDLKSAVVLGPFDIINLRARADLQNEGTKYLFPATSFYKTGPVQVFGHGKN